MRGKELDGKSMRVDYSVTKRAHTPNPGRYMGRRTPPLRHSRRRSPSPYSRRRSPSPYYRRRSPSPHYRRRSPSPIYRRRSPSPYARRRSPSPYYRHSLPGIGAVSRHISNVVRRPSTVAVLHRRTTLVDHQHHHHPIGVVTDQLFFFCRHLDVTLSVCVRACACVYACMCIMLICTSCPVCCYNFFYVGRNVALCHRRDVTIFFIIIVIIILPSS